MCQGVKNIVEASNRCIKASIVIESILAQLNGTARSTEPLAAVRGYANGVVVWFSHILFAHCVIHEECIDIKAEAFFIAAKRAKTPKEPSARLPEIVVRYTLLTRSPAIVAVD